MNRIRTHHLCVGKKAAEHWVVLIVLSEFTDRTDYEDVLSNINNLVLSSQSSTLRKWQILMKKLNIHS